MNSFMAIAALLLVAALGAGLWALALGRPRDGATWASCAGGGFVLGCLVLATVLKLFSTMPPAQLFPVLAIPLGIVSALLWGAASFLRAPQPPAPAPHRELPWVRGLTVLLLVAMLLQAAVLVEQAWRLPTLPWDAWTTWIARARAWYGAEAMLPFVAVPEWLQQAPGEALATLAPHYPLALSRLTVWLASAAGQWSEPAVHLLWPAWWVALGLLVFGQFRRLGAMTVEATLCAFVVLSLPLLSAHVALAGYADLPLACTVLAAMSQLVVWRQERRPGDLALAIVLALLLPALKLEGAVWLCGFALALLFAALPVRWPPRLLLGMLALAGLALALGGFSLPLPGLGWVRLSWGEFHVDALGSMELSWRPVGTEVLASLFLLPNWHLLWYLAPLVVGLCWRALRADRATQAAGWFLLFAYGFLFVLFFLTDAARWAENYTSVNRVLLHVVPTTVLFLGMLLIGERRRLEAA